MEPVLQTLLTEVERVLTGRALTANSDDPNDPQPLTPAHFLMQRKSICLPPDVFEKADHCRRKCKQVQFLANLFWKRWVREYLPTLQIRGKWRKVCPNLRPNALVRLVDDNAPRGHWDFGRVLSSLSWTWWNGAHCQSQDQGLRLYTTNTKALPVREWLGNGLKKEAK